MKAGEKKGYHGENCFRHSPDTVSRYPSSVRGGRGGQAWRDGSTSVTDANKTSWLFYLSSLHRSISLMSHQHVAVKRAHTGEREGDREREREREREQ